MRAIPKKLRDKLSSDPFMKRCCLADDECDGKIDWHHVFIYRNRQISEWWAIMPVCGRHHTKRFLEVVEYMAFQRAPIEEMIGLYPRFDWRQRKIYLEDKIKYKIENIIK